MTDDIKTAEDGGAEKLSLYDLVHANYNNVIADRILDEFINIPFVLTGHNELDSDGEYYDYVKKCVADGHKVPSAVEYCSRFLKGGKYTFGEVSEEDYAKFVSSPKLTSMILT